MEFVDFRLFHASVFEYYTLKTGRLILDARREAIALRHVGFFMGHTRHAPVVTFA